MPKNKKQKKVKKNKKSNTRPKPTPEQLRRLDWDEMFMNIALMAGKRTSCIYHKVGAVFIDNNHRIISIGYNGPCAGDVHCIEVGCAKIDGDPITGEIKPCRGIHSEINAICNCADPSRLRNSILYVTVFPCYRCMKSLVNVGIRKIVYLEDYLRVIPGTKERIKTEPEPEALALARRSNIIIEKFDAKQKNVAQIKIDYNF